jgi:hypothetical protein
MAKIVANMDNYNPLWESEELKDLLENGKNEKAVEWLKEHCSCEESDADNVELFSDGAVFEHEGYKLLYSDLGYIERIDLIKND